MGRGPAWAGPRSLVAVAGWLPEHRDNGVEEGQLAAKIVSITIVLRSYIIIMSTNAHYSIINGIQNLQECLELHLAMLSNRS